MRFVELFSYDPVRDPEARLRLEFETASDGGLAILSDENTLPEHVTDPDAKYVRSIASIDLGLAAARWLHDALGRLIPLIEARDVDEQAELERIGKERAP